LFDIALYRIEPLIYERLSFLYWFDRMPLLLATIDARPASFFAANIKYLYFDQTIGELPVVQRILSVCTGVVSLGCHHSYSNLAPLLAPLPLQRLLVSEFTPTHAADLPASLTHLGLSQTLPQDLPAAFAALPAFVYFAVGVRAVPDKARMAGALTGLLRACPRIHCLVLVTCTMAQYRWARQCLLAEAIDRLHVCSDGWDAWPSDIFARVGAINI
jgi:hypothetical protein